MTSSREFVCTTRTSAKADGAAESPSARAARTARQGRRRSVDAEWLMIVPPSCPLFAGSPGAGPEMLDEVGDELVDFSLVQLGPVRNHRLDEAAPARLIVIALVRLEAAEVVARRAARLEQRAAGAGRERGDRGRGYRARRRLARGRRLRRRRWRARA